jgi:hypothetical protein
MWELKLNGKECFFCPSMIHSSISIRLSMYPSIHSDGIFWEYNIICQNGKSSKFKSQWFINAGTGTQWKKGGFFLSIHNSSIHGVCWFTLTVGKGEEGGK